MDEYYVEKVEYMHGFKVVVKRPILSEEERRDRESRIVRKLIKLFSEEDN